MTTLVKDTNQKLGGPPAWRRSAHVEQGAAVEDATTQGLRAEIAQLHRDAQATALRHEADLARAREEAQREAKAEFVRDEAKRLAAVETSVRSLDRRFTEALADMEALALAMSEEALSLVFDRREDLTELVTRAIERQLGLIRREGLVHVWVSAADFQDADAVQHLSQRLSLTHVLVATDPALQSGDGRLQLRLGEIDISLSRYWSEIIAVLADARRERGAP